MDWRDLVSRHTLSITPSCGLRCLGCSLWTTHPIDFDEPETVSVAKWATIDNVGLSNIVPRTHRINLVGGDPMLVPDLPRVLRILARNQVSVRIWTPLVREVPDEIAALLRRSGGGVAVVMPAPDSDAYRLQAGWDGANRVVENLTQLVDVGVPCVLVAHVTPTLVEWLPYWHDHARLRGIPLWVTYYAFESFSKTERDYIHRYNWVKDCVTIPLHKRHRHTCMAVPHRALGQDWGVGRIWFKQQIDAVRHLLQV